MVISTTEPKAWRCSIDQRITQAMLQLALNASQHTSTDQEIHLGTEIVGDQLHLWVRDTGSGVPPADREQVFDRFARDDSTDGDSFGIGLGLAIVRAIAHSHGGQLVLAETSAGSGGADGTAAPSPERDLAATGRTPPTELMQ